MCYARGLALANFSFMASTMQFLFSSDRQPQSNAWCARVQPALHLIQQ